VEIMAWVKGSDGKIWHNLDLATKAWVQPCQDMPGHFEVMAHITGTDVRLGASTHNSEALAKLVLKNFLS
jgi:hypothetical protein